MGEDLSAASGERTDPAPAPWRAGSWALARQETRGGAGALAGLCVRLLTGYRAEDMLPFDLVFESVARKESRAVTLRDARGGFVGSFLYRELYCAESGCNCGLVLIHALWAERREVAASFSYCFEPARGEPQLELDPFNPQSELSPVLLEMFEQALAQDPGYRPALLRHYAMWRRVVDDPTHPDHAKLGKRERGGRPKKPARKRAPASPMPKSKAKQGQRALPFEVTAAAGRADAETSATGVELIARMGPKTEGKLQQRFRKLLEKVDRLKLRLRAWREHRAEIDSAIASAQAGERRHDELVRKMVFLLDGAHGKLSKADRRFVSEVIADLAGELLRDDGAEGGDEELKRVFERHARQSFADNQAKEAAAMRSMLGSLGLDLGEDVDLSSPDKVMEKLEAWQGEQAKAEEERRARRKRSAKQVAAEEKRAEEARDAHKAVQEIYRQLARSMHPDRESDPAERDRKTMLMREINAAYEARDLLALLELQLRLERVDGAANPESLAEERIAQYIRVLEEQAKQLAVELDTIELPFRVHIDRAPGEALTPAVILEQIRVDIRRTEEVTLQLRNDLSMFADLAQLKQWLKEERAMRPRTPRDAGPFDIPF